MNNSYINKDAINNKIYDYIASYINCSIDQLKEEGTHFVKNKNAAKNYVKILASEIQISFLCLKKNMNLENNCYPVKLEMNYMKVP